MSYYYKPNKYEDAFTTLCISIVLLFLMPLLSYASGFLVGLLIKNVFPNLFIDGLKLINVNIGIEQIPSLCGILNLIGSFFKTSKSS